MTAARWTFRTPLEWKVVFYLIWVLQVEVPIARRAWNEIRIVSYDLVFRGNPGRCLILNKEVENVKVFHFLLKGRVQRYLLVKRSLRVPGPLGPLWYHQLRIRLQRLKSLILIMFAYLMRII